jgi:WD40 repeat protein
VKDFASSLERFLEDLPEDAGVVFGIRERLAVDELLIALVEAGQFPADPAVLKTLLAPLLCSSRQQQEAFYARYEAWISKSDDPPPPPPLVHVRRLTWRVLALGLTLFVVVAAASTVVWYKVREWMKPVPQLVSPVKPPPVAPSGKVQLTGSVVSETGQPVSGAEIWIPGLKQSSSLSGAFTFEITNPADSIPVLLWHPDYNAHIETVALHQGTTNVHVRLTRYGSSPRVELGSASLIRQIPGPSLSSTAECTISPDGGTVATVSGNSVMLWDSFTGREKARIPVAGNNRVVFSPDGQSVVTVGPNHTLRVSDSANGKSRIELIDADLPAAISPDGQRIVVAGGSGSGFNGLNFLGNPKPGGLLVLAGLGIYGAAFSPDGRKVVVAVGDGAVVADSGNRELLRGLHHTGNVTDASFSADGQRIVTASRDGTARVWDASSYKQLLVLEVGPPIGYAEFSPDGQRIVTDGGQVWNASTGQLIADLPFMKTPKFSPDSAWMTVAENNGSLQVFEGATGRRLTLASYNVCDSGFAKDGSLLVAARDFSTQQALSRWSWTGALLPLLALAAWWIWLYKKRSRLRRFSLPWELDTRALTVPNSPPLFQNPFIRKLGIEMRRRKPQPLNELAVESTVAASVRRGGFFTPVFGSRTFQREYLILLQKTSAGDLQARLYSDLFASLGSQGALIDLYTFQSTPANVRDPQSGAILSLEELAARHPHHDLWIVCDPATLLDPFTLALPVWTAELSRWQDRAVLSPAAVDTRTRLVLEAQGFRVSSAYPEGIEALLDTMDSEQGAVPAPVLPGFPELLRHLPTRWLERRPPADGESAQMMSDLRRFLGHEGLQLFSACAVYPELSWGLTLWLAERLCDPSRRNAVVTRLASLPWFRYGRIPDWMRVRLVARLTPAMEGKVREAIEQFLDRLKPAAGEETVQFGKRESVAEDKGRPVEDYVMMSFLSGEKLDERMVVRPPSRLRRLLFRGGHFLFGARWIAHVAGALVLAALGWFATSRGVALTPARLVLNEWKLPAAPPVAEPVTVRSLPDKPLLRAMVAVAASQTDEAIRAGGAKIWQQSFVQDVAAMANLLVTGTAGAPKAAESPTPAAGFSLANGFVASIAGEGDADSGAGRQRSTGRRLDPTRYVRRFQSGCRSVCCVACPARCAGPSPIWPAVGHPERAHKTRLRRSIQSRWTIAGFSERR